LECAATGHLSVARRPSFLSRYSGRFIWPQAKDGVVSLTMAQLSMLLESIDWRATAWTARPEVVV
jgi:transposase